MVNVDLKSLLEKLNAHGRQALEAAAGACLARTHYEVTVEHVLSALLLNSQNDVALILKHFSVEPSAIEFALRATLESLRGGNSGKPVFSPLLIEWLQDAWLISSVDLGETEIRSGALLAALLNKTERLISREAADALHPVARESLIERFRAIVKTSLESAASSPNVRSGVAPSAGTALEKFCTDFTKKAEAGEIDPVFGRDREIYQMIDILSRRRKNNPILVGEAGVGKTAVVEGLALRVVRGAVPESLKNILLIALDMGLLQAGAGVQGEFENRLKSVIQEIKSSPKPVILFIDEAHTLIGAGGPAGGGDAANLLKPALARGELRTIAATTWAEYKKYFEKDAALARRFQPVKLDEPSVENTILMLRGLKARYEEAHGVIVRDSAIVAAVEQSSRYISGRQQPDKAVDLLDTSAARVKILLTTKPSVIEDLEREAENLVRERSGLERDALHGEKSRSERLRHIDRRLKSAEEEIAALTARWQAEKAAAAKLTAARQALCKYVSSGGNGVTQADLTNAADQAARELKKVQGQHPLITVDVDPETVAKVVSDWTGIPLGKLRRAEAETIQHLEIHLAKRIRGQSQAVNAIGRALRASKSGLTDPQQPLGVFLFVGPSGVGKTETALAIAELLFGGERSMVTVNMSEFKEAHSVSRLIGSPPGYVGFGEGGVLTEAVRRQPYSAVLIDETEKAHIDVMNLFYQVFDKGSLSDGEGRVIDFKNTALFLTSNLGSEKLLELCANDARPDPESVIEAIRPILSKHFKPALLARMTIVPFYSLGAAELREIVTLKLGRLAARVFARHRVRLVIDETVGAAIAARCRDVDSGARNIDHILGGALLPLLSTEIVGRLGSGKLPEKLYVSVDAAGAFSVTADHSVTKPLEPTHQDISS